MTSEGSSSIMSILSRTVGASEPALRLLLSIIIGEHYIIKYFLCLHTFHSESFTFQRQIQLYRTIASDLKYIQ